MDYISVDNTATAATKARAANFNSNFSSLVDGLDGTTVKDINIGAFAPGLDATAASATISDDGHLHTLLVTSGASDRTVTLPTSIANAGRVITVKKIDSGVGKVTVAVEGGEVLDDKTSIDLFLQNDSVTIQCYGASGWYIINKHLKPVTIRHTSESTEVYGTGAVTQVNFTTASWDSHNAGTISSGTTSGFGFKAPRNGKYLVNFSWAFVASGAWLESEGIIIRCKIDAGLANIILNESFGTDSGAISIGRSARGSAMFDLSTGSVLTAWVEQGSGGNLTASGLGNRQWICISEVGYE